MAKTREQKTELLNKYKGILEEKSGYFLLDSDNTDTLTISDLKAKLKDTNANYVVIKNSIFKVALQDTKQPLETQDIDGPTAIVFFEEDPTSPAKLIKEIQKEAELLRVKGGVYKGEYLKEEKVLQLADIPSREVLLSQLVGSLNAPVLNIMNAITGNIRGLTTVLKGISEK